MTLRTIPALLVGLMLGAAVVSLRASDPCETPTAPPSDIGTTRDNPVALGDWIPFNRGDMTGRFRVAETATLTDVTGFRADFTTPAPGAPLLAVTVEYECTSINTPCILGMIIANAARITDEGRVQEPIGDSNTLRSTAITDTLDDMSAEVYGGLTLRGVLYFDIGADEPLGQLRLSGYFIGEYLFFSLLAG